MIGGSLADRVLPEPLSTWLVGANLSLGLLAFFALSTALLWASALASHG